MAYVDYDSTVVDYDGIRSRHLGRDTNRVNAHLTVQDVGSSLELAAIKRANFEPQIMATYTTRSGGILCSSSDR